MSRGADQHLIVGRVLDAFGVKGQIKVRAFTDPPQNLLSYENWILSTADSAERSFTVTAGKVQKNNVIVSLQDVSTRDEALALKGADVRVPYSLLPELPPGEYYWCELLELKVTDVDGTEYGVVKDIIETGANDVLVVNGDKTHLIPYINQVILEVDLEQGTMRVDWFEEF